MRRDDGEHPEWFDVTQGLRQGCVLSPLPCKMLFAVAIHVILVRFSKDEDDLRGLVGGGGGGEESLACVRGALWGMLSADDAGIVSTSAEGFAKKNKVGVVVYEATTGLTVSENKAETMLLQKRDQTSRAPPFVIEAGGKMCKHMMRFLYLSGVNHEDVDLMVEIDR